MFKIKYKNCLIVSKNENNLYVLTPINKDYKIKIIKSVNDNINLLIYSKNKLLINNKEYQSEDKINIFLDQLRIIKIVDVKNDDNTLNNIYIEYDNIKNIDECTNDKKIIKIFKEDINEKLNFNFMKNKQNYLNDFINSFEFDTYYNKLINEFNNEYNIKIDKNLKDPKIQYRYFCYRYINHMRLFDLSNIEKNKELEAVLIEYRCFPHLEFILRNAIKKIGNEWSYTVICGNLNFDFITRMCLNISPNIKIIKTDYDNLNQSTYSKFLTSIEFWNLLIGKKILIYQEDSYIYKSNINDFLEYDYIGAPWNKNQNDNINCVGNGGFSLRTKQCMIDVINKISIENTIFNSSTINYMKSCNMTIGPEDVYFSLNMITYKIGKVADWDTAFKFSSESIYNPNSLGGHNFWINDKNWKINLYNNLFNFKNTCAISSPYGLNIGGGENNLLNFIKYFIIKKNSIIYLFITDKIEIIKNSINRIIGDDYIPYFKFYSYNEIYKYKNMMDYHFDMCNLKVPCIWASSIKRENSLFHCQFPFDTTNTVNDNILLTYKNIVVNSDFTAHYYKKFTERYLTDHKIHIIYPCCFINTNNIIFDKEPNSFLMIGRIFNYNSNSNNKNFDIALKYFEKISQMGHNNFKIYIIGAVYSYDMLNKLKNFKIKNIEIFNNATDEIKNNIIKKSKYIINMVGLNRNINTESYAYEHFGISILEGINFGCIPITINGGYPSYYINNDNGIIFNNENEFYNKIKEIIIENKKYEFNYLYFNDFLKKFTFEYFSNSIDNIFVDIN